MAAGSILIIEDEIRLRNNLQILLSRAGYTVTTAGDGQDGIECLQHASFDVVITDLVMHEVDGFKAMKYIAAQAPATPVIVITGYTSTASAIAAIREGAYDYIGKPFDVEMLQVAIERALEKVSLQRELQAYRQDLDNRVAERTQALEETNRQLHRSLIELQSAHEQFRQTEKLSVLGELIAGVTHELDHPLGVILGYTEALVTSYVCAPEVRSGLEKIRQEAQRGHDMVASLRSFARQRQPEKTRINVNSVCLKTLELLADQFKVHNITVVKHLADDLPETMVDARQLQQVLVHVFTNAYQAMAEQQGQRQLRITTVAAHDKLWIEAADTGPGIAAERLHCIFDPFYTTKEQSAGLGLSLSYGIIKEHGGELTVASTPGQGTTCTIEFPLLAYRRIGQIKRRIGQIKHMMLRRAALP
jgi:C4-dicarboxylate-specific signal transduction histidine kinase